jgi:hypothetical protein
VCCPFCIIKLLLSSSYILSLRLSRVWSGVRVDRASTWWCLAAHSSSPHFLLYSTARPCLDRVVCLSRGLSYHQTLMLAITCISLLLLAGVYIKFTFKFFRRTFPRCLDIFPHFLMEYKQKGGKQNKTNLHLLVRYFSLGHILFQSVWRVSQIGFSLCYCLYNFLIYS